MIRDYRPDDAESVLALNNACVPEVGVLDREKLDNLVSWSPYFRLVDLGDEDNPDVVGLLIGLDHTAPYQSPNYGWFVPRFDRFAYIDRIAIADSARGQGWGPAMYADFEAWARDVDLPRLCAEVNVVPPNHRSVRFHDIYGFDQLEEFEPTGSPDYRVVMVAKPLT